MMCKGRSEDVFRLVIVKEVFMIDFIIVIGMLYSFLFWWNLVFISDKECEIIKGEFIVFSEINIRTRIRNVFFGFCLWVFV